MSDLMLQPVLEFNYDISCPFAYIASTKIDSLATRTGARVIWRPVLLGAIYRATNAPQGAAGSASDVFNPTKKQVTSRAFERTIKRHGIPYKQPLRHPIKTTAALRLLYTVHEVHRPQLSKALFRAYWVDSSDVSDNEVLIDVVRGSGIPQSEALIKRIQDGSFEGERQRTELERATNDAVQRGSPGVPGFWVAGEVWVDGQGRRRKGRLYWGQDRMHFVEAVLEATREGKQDENVTRIGSISTPLNTLLPRCTSTDKIPLGEEVKLEFWYDFSSPWAFLGWTQLERLRRQFGERLHIEMKPFLLGILFRDVGAPNLPMAAISEQKRKYSSLDHSDWVRWWNALNLQNGSPDNIIDFYWADIFPIRTPTVLRAVLVEPKLIDSLFRACWERNLDMSSSKVLESVINESGFDGRKILAEGSNDARKNELRRLTKEAKEAGLCGAPSYRVFRRRLGQPAGQWKQHGDIVWGQDEIAVVEDLIAGWNDSFAQDDAGLYSRL